VGWYNLDKKRACWSDTVNTIMTAGSEEVLLIKEGMNDVNYLNNKRLSLWSSLF
jgi:hypothetical protein